MITIKIGTLSTSAKDIAIRCGDDYYNVTATLADDSTDIRQLRSTFDEAFDGTVTLPDSTVISGLEIRDLTRTYSEDDVHTTLRLEAVSNVEE